MASLQARREKPTTPAGLIRFFRIHLVAVTACWHQWLRTRLGEGIDLVQALHVRQLLDMLLGTAVLLTIIVATVIPVGISTLLVQIALLMLKCLTIGIPVTLARELGRIHYLLLQRVLLLLRLPHGVHFMRSQ